MDKRALRDTFEDIDQKGWWSSTESVSGRGSEVANTTDIREEFGNWLDRHPDVTSVLDAPCGDFNWMQLVKPLQRIRYVGGDIVRELIATNTSRYASERCSFIHLDVTSDPIPAVDAWFCRDLMIHLPLDLCATVVAQFRASPARYLIATSYVGTTNDKDIAVGRYHKINLECAPFDLGPASEKLRDPAENNQRDRYMGVWAKE